MFFLFLHFESHVFSAVIVLRSKKSKRICLRWIVTIICSYFFLANGFSSDLHGNFANLVPKADINFFLFDIVSDWFKIILADVGTLTHYLFSAGLYQCGNQAIFFQADFLTPELQVDCLKLKHKTYSTLMRDLTTQGGRITIYALKLMFVLDLT